MVLENIVFLLNNFLHVSAYQHIIFSWVMHQQEIIDELLSRVDTSACTTHVISLICKPEILQKRLERDIDAGVRQADSLDRAAAYLPLYSHLHTRKIDVSALTPVQTAQAIVALCGQ